MTLAIITAQPTWPMNIHAVHLLDGGRHAFAEFNVTELEDGRVLKVSSFMAREGSPPPPVRWWRDFAAAFFPGGEIVAGDRMGDDGALLSWARPFGAGARLSAQTYPAIIRDVREI